MDQPKINFPGVLAAAAAMWVLGMAWYSIFGTSWMTYTGITMEMAQQMSGADMAISYGGSFIAYIVLFYCMAHVIHAFKAQNAKGGAEAGFWSWLGFTATALFVSYTYQNKPIGLFFIDSGYWLIGMVAGGIILVKMQKKEAAAMS